MDWNDVRHFLALARLGSVRAAGASLGVSHSTVARRVEALEERLSARLFDRNRDGYMLTEAGRQMLPGAERIEAEMASLERGLAGQDERLEGPVSVTCCDDWIADMLLRDLLPWCDNHPGIELHFDASGRLFDLSKREADVAIRAQARGSQPPDHLIGACIAPLFMANFVGREHATRVDPGLGATNSRWAAFDDRKIQTEMIAGSSYPDLPMWGGFSSLELMVRSARRGVGLSMLPVYVGDQEAELQRATRSDLRHVGDIWLISHADLRDNARFRAVRAQIRTVFERNAPLFHGERPIGAPQGPEIAPDAHGSDNVG